jgi:hypothetical protein
MKAIVTVLLAGLVLVFAVQPAKAQFSYITNNGSLTITGYTGPGGAVTIPDMLNGLPVTAIGDNAFYICLSLRSVTIPDSVTNIGIQAFYHCHGLTNAILGNHLTTISELMFAYSGLQTITIPNSVTDIGDYAFYDTLLTRLTISDSITNIGTYAFYGCYLLPSVTIGTNLTSIGGYAFTYCTDMTNIVIPDSVTSIGDYAFYDCTSLTTVSIPDNFTNIGFCVFESCKGLTNIAFGSHVVRIGVGEFADCESLAAVTIPDSVTDIEPGAFSSCGLSQVTIPGNVTNVGDEAFGFCLQLGAIAVDAANPAYTSVGGVLFDKSQTTLVEYPAGIAGSYAIPNGVTVLGSGAFGGCGRLTGVIIPDTVTVLEHGSFDGCSNLTSITIPASVTSLGSRTFLNASHLQRIYFQGDAPSQDGTEFYGVPNVSNTNATVYYLPGTFGWGTRYGNLATAQWYLPNPLILAQGPGFGAQNGQFGFTISWATNAAVVVEASTNLAQPAWLPLATNTLTAGSAIFSDPDWTNFPARLYRLRSP